MALARRAFAVAAAATGAAYTGAGGLYEMHVSEVTAVAAAGTFRLYDQAAGPVATNPIAVIRLAADRPHQFEFPKGIKFSLGLLVEATGADLQGGFAIGGSGAVKPRFFSADAAPLYSGAINIDSLLVAETAGAAAEVAMHDALAIAGTPYVRLPLVANENIYYRWPQGVAFNTGITIDEMSGAVEGVVYTL